MDHPNDRSLHNQAIPRTGGVAIVIGITVGLIFLFGIGQFSISKNILWLLLGAIIIAFISFLDDRHNLSVSTRFLFHCVAASLILIGGWGPGILSLPIISISLPFVIVVIFTLLFTVWMINLYNFMDGMDGFAAGMAIIGFSTFGIAGYIQGESLFVAVNIIIISSTAGFLLFNFPPARIFMGDIGSSTLGYLAAAMILWGDQAGVLPLWLGALVFSPFIIDATVTLIRRILKGEKFWRAHKTHYYQRVVELGWGHRRTVLAEYGIMVLASVTVLSIMKQPNGWIGLLVLLVWGMIYIILAISIQHMERVKVQQDGRI